MSAQIEKIENGGNFELWNDDRSSPLTIVSEQNRLVVMETTRFSWHSVSKVREGSSEMLHFKLLFF